MELLTENGDINNLHVQHTFYIDAKYITSLFNEFNYSLNEKLNYADNSLFFHFKNQNLDKEVLIKAYPMSLINQFENSTQLF